MPRGAGWNQTGALRSLIKYDVTTLFTLPANQPVNDLSDAAGIDYLTTNPAFSGVQPTSGSFRFGSLASRGVYAPVTMSPN
jgi:hypothetical protein